MLLPKSALLRGADNGANRDNTREPLASVYVEDPEGAAKVLGRRAADAGAKVVLVGQSECPDADLACVRLPRYNELLVHHG